jgi:hypothetical protein
MEVKSDVSSRIRSQMGMAEFHYIECLQVTSENRARNDILKGEVDETSVTKNLENRALRWDGYTERMKEKITEN